MVLGRKIQNQTIPEARKAAKKTKSTPFTVRENKGNKECDGKRNL